MSAIGIIHEGIYPHPLPLTPMTPDISEAVLVFCLVVVSIVYTITWRSVR